MRSGFLISLILSTLLELISRFIDWIGGNWDKIVAVELRGKEL